MFRRFVLTLLRCGNVRPDCAGLSYFYSLCVAGVRLGWRSNPLAAFLAARLLAAFLCLHFVYPPSNETRETAEK